MGRHRCVGAQSPQTEHELTNKAEQKGREAGTFFREKFLADKDRSSVYVGVGITKM